MGSQPVIISGNTLRRSVRNILRKPNSHTPNPIILRFATLLLLLVLPVAETSAQSATGIWEQRAIPLPPAGQYSFIDFCDSVYGWVMSSNGVYTMTSDGGSTWSPVHSVPDSGTVVQMRRFGRDTALVVTRPATMFTGPHTFLRTTDRGATWSSMIVSDILLSSRWISVINDSLIGYISGRGEGLKTSTDLGKTWQSDSLRITPIYVEYTLGILSPRRMFLCANSDFTGYIKTSTDGGTTWTDVVSAQMLFGTSATFVNREMCYFGATYGADFPVWHNYFAYNAALDSRAQLRNYSAGVLFNDGTLFTFLTGSWMNKRISDPADSTYLLVDQVSRPGGTRIASIAAWDPQHAWVLDESGNVYRLTDRLTAVGGATATLPEGFALLQNYPNPFNPSTTVRYELPSAGEVDLRVTDVLGREVYRVVGGQAAGEHTETIELQGHASGVYYCIVQFNSGARQTVKMALVR